MPEKVRRLALPLCLLIQASLLLWRLDLLPIWGDEHFTMRTVVQPVGSIVAAVGADIHPPLYYLLLHAWLGLPWRVDALVAARALSVLFTLLATLAIDRLWLRAVRPPVRIAFLLLWTFSPCLLLYGRMARSYSLQVLLSVLAFHAALRFWRAPRSWRAGVVHALATACLLYVHYVPGMAVLVAVTVLFCWKAARLRRIQALVPALLAGALAVLLYAPWLGFAGRALGRVARASPYSPVAASLLSQGLKLSYCFFSFSFGETPPLWAAVAAALLSPCVMWLLWRGARQTPDWLAGALLAAAVAYAGAGRWVSFAFIPARLIFVLPLFVLLLAMGAESLGRTGRVILAGVLVLSAASIASYFRKDGFLNKGYLIPYGDIAATVNQGSEGLRALAVVDTINTDPQPLTADLRREIDVVEVSPGVSCEGLKARIGGSGPGVIWYFHNTHDISPGGVNRRLEAELAAGRTVRRREYVPYCRLDRAMMSLLGWPERPTHALVLLEFR